MFIRTLPMKCYILKVHAYHPMDFDITIVHMYQVQSPSSQSLFLNVYLECEIKLIFIRNSCQSTKISPKV